MGRKTSDAKWEGAIRVCNENHYDSFSTIDETGSRIIINVHSFVFIRTRSLNKYQDSVAYVKDLYENKDNEKIARVRWFKFPDEAKLPKSEIDPNEVLITPTEHDTNVDCIKGVAIVLTRNHFKEWLKIFPEDYGSQNYFCHREYTSKHSTSAVKRPVPFALNKLDGYEKQPAVKFLTGSTKTSEMGEGSGLGKLAGTDKQQGNESSMDVNDPKVVAPEAVSHVFKVNDNVEVLNMDSGLRGCWFKVKILKSLPKHFKVLHCDVLGVDGPEKLEEYVPCQKVADADEYGMRCPGRLTVRPWPPRDDPSGYAFEVGGAVDVWYCDGWWECVIIAFLQKQDKIRVFSPGEKKFMNVRRSHVRVSRDWVDGQWISIEPKHDFNPMQKPLPVLEDGKRNLTNSSKAVDPKGGKDIGGASTSGTANEN